MAQQQKESITKIENGKQTLLYDELPFGEAFAMVMRLRRFMNTIIADGNLSESRRTYYRLGRPH